NIKGECRYLFPVESQLITTCSYPTNQDFRHSDIFEKEGNIKGEWRYLFPAEPQFITTCSYPTIKTSATLMYSNRKDVVDAVIVGMLDKS
nr:hypothetical protein [Tanacetum cinerariifolium]